MVNVAIRRVRVMLVVLSVIAWGLVVPNVYGQGVPSPTQNPPPPPMPATTGAGPVTSAPAPTSVDTSTPYSVGSPGASASVGFVQIVPNPPGAPPSNVGLYTAAGSCANPQPGPTWVCSNGYWVDQGDQGLGTTIPLNPPEIIGLMYVPGPGTPAFTTEPQCAGLQPSMHYVCMNGVWVPSAPGASSRFGYGLPGANPGVPASSPQPCYGDPPGPGFACINGGWVARN